MKTKISRAAAEKYAAQFTAVIVPHCTIFNLAGSFARECLEVGDLEIVALVPAKNRNKLGMEPMKIFHVVKGTFAPTARYVMLSLKGFTLQVDLFLPTDTDYYRQLAIRTGSADYSKLIATAWVKKGWVGTTEGLRLRAECTEKSSWVCNVQAPTLPPAWESEIEFFDWLNIPYKHPKNR